MANICTYKNCTSEFQLKKNQQVGYFSQAKQPYCSLNCYAEELADDVIEKKNQRTHQAIWKMQIGLLLLKRNLIDQNKLNQALEEKTRSGKRIGEILVDSGHISENDLKSALSIQAGVASITLDSSTAVLLSDTIPHRLFYFFNMTVFSVTVDEKVISVAVSDVQDLNYLTLFFEKIFYEYHVKYYLDTPENIQSVLQKNLPNFSGSQYSLQNVSLPIMEQHLESVILNFLQFLNRFGGRNTKVDHLDQSLWVRSDFDGYQVDIYLTPKG